jgi:hypothetical protein
MNAWVGCSLPRSNFMINPASSHPWHWLFPPILYIFKSFFIFVITWEIGRLWPIYYSRSFVCATVYGFDSWYQLSVETVPGIGGGGIKDSSRGVNSNIYLIHSKNLCKCHNVPPPSITIKEKDLMISKTGM